MVVTHDVAGWDHAVNLAVTLAKSTQQKRFVKQCISHAGCWVVW